MKGKLSGRDLKGGEYVLEFEIYKGKKMKEVSSKDLYYLATYLRQEMKKRSGPFPLFIHALEFLDNYKFFMDEKDKAK